jgi:hypothetical protein
LGFVGISFLTAKIATVSFLGFDGVGFLTAKVYAKWHRFFLYECPLSGLVI